MLYKSVMKTFLKSFIVVAAILSTSTFAHAFAGRLPSSDDSGSTPKPTPTPTPKPTPQPTPKPTPKPTPSPTPVPSTGFKAGWEKSNSSRAAWTQIVRDVVANKAPALLRGPADVDDFCPMYDRLGTQDRLNFWAEFFSAVARYESGWSPTSRMIETTMGTDPYTGRQVASEGLLQLSYQDVQWAPYCEFDWSVDKKYSDTDARKSIFDPAKNLNCGIQILDRQVAKKSNIALSTGVYWAVLKINGKYTKLPEIKATTNALSFCKK